MKTFTDDPDLEPQWFEKTESRCTLCPQRATGILRGRRNQSYGPYCERCANKRINDAKKARERIKKEQTP